jgi:peptidoglycan/xylan/chitin deacetylase (PgdA/CDA1 family)
MVLSVPKQYHSLEPFRQFFQTGLPVLMYHKIGTRPNGVRLKGLYVSTKNFVRQLDELRQADFATASPSEVLSAAATPPKRVVLTFDDGFRNVFQNALEPLSKNKFCAIQFLVPNFIGKLNEWDLRDGEAPEPLMDAPEVREWLAAGHQIGSHSLSHARLTRLSLRDAREEIFTSKKKLEDAFSIAIEHFCYPYGDWNEAVRDVVIEAGYRSACTTDFGVNTAATSAFALNRITVRYPSRSLKALKARLFE